MHGCKNVNDHAGGDQRRPKPYRQAVPVRLKTGFDETYLLQEKTEAGHHESEPHEREACANPSEKRSLGREIIAHITVFWHFRTCSAFTRAFCLADTGKSTADEKIKRRIYRRDAENAEEDGEKPKTYHRGHGEGAESTEKARGLRPRRLKLTVGKQNQRQKRPPKGGRCETNSGWRDVAEHLRRARHAVPLRNRSLQPRHAEWRGG